MDGRLRNGVGWADGRLKYEWKEITSKENGIYVHIKLLLWICEL